MAKAPDYDIALRRLGSCLVRQNKRAEGLALCERALALNRSAENLSTLAYALVADTSKEENRAELRLPRSKRIHPRSPKHMRAPEE